MSIESQRDSGSQPGVAELARLPWVTVPFAPNRNAVVASLTLHHCDAYESRRHDGHNRVAVGSASTGVPRVVLVPRTNPGLQASTPLALQTRTRPLETGDWELETPCEGHVPSRGADFKPEPSPHLRRVGAPGLQNWRLESGNSAEILELSRPPRVSPCVPRGSAGPPGFFISLHDSKVEFLAEAPQPLFLA